MKYINLLPPSEQALLYKEKMYQSIKTFLFWSFFLYAIVVLVLIGEKYYVEYTASNVDAEIAQQKAFISKEDNVTLKNEIDADNAVVSDYNRLSVVIPEWSTILKNFASLVPSEVYVTNLSGNSTTGRIDISGVGGTRQSVLDLRDNILASPDFKNINLPFENLQKAINVNFHYTFFLKVIPAPAPEKPKTPAKK